MRSKKRGTRIGFMFFRVVLKLIGLRGAYFFLYFPCSYYLLLDREAVRAARVYIGRRFPERGWCRQHMAIFRLFLMQGKVLIDRYCMVYRPDMFELEFHGYDQIKDTVENAEQGLVLLMSHTGNWQAVLSAIRHLRRPVCLLMRSEDNQAVAEVLRLNHGDGELRIVSPEQFLGGVIELMKWIHQGYLVAIMGDRSYDFNAVQVDYLGGQADFPYGAFTIAAATECPVMALMSSKHGTNHYDIEVGCCFTPRYENKRDKKRSLQKWTQAYATLLEKYAMEHPYQCFLFHDVWKEQANDEKVN